MAIINNGNLLTKVIGGSGGGTTFPYNGVNIDVNGLVSTTVDVLNITSPGDLITKEYLDNRIINGEISYTVGSTGDFLNLEEVQTFLENNINSMYTDIEFQLLDETHNFIINEKFGFILNGTSPNITISGVDKNTTIINFSKAVGADYLGGFYIKDGCNFSIENVTINDISNINPFRPITYNYSIGFLKDLIINGGDKSINIDEHSTVSLQNIEVTSSYATYEGIIHIQSNSIGLFFNNIIINGNPSAFGLYVNFNSSASFGSGATLTTDNTYIGAIAEYNSKITKFDVGTFNFSNSTYGLIASAEKSFITLRTLPNFTNVTTPYFPAEINTLQKDNSIIIINPTSIKNEFGLEVFDDGSATLNNVDNTKIESRGVKSLVTKEYVDNEVSNVSNAVNIVTESSLATFTPDLSVGNYFEYTVNQNTTINLPINMTKGAEFKLIIIQDVIGNHSVTFDFEYEVVGPNNPWIAAADIHGYFRGEIIEVRGSLKVVLQLIKAI